MYQSIIELKKDLPEDVLIEANTLIDKAFDNRCGRVLNTSSETFILIHQANEDMKPCLHIGLMSIKTKPQLMSCIHSWKWIDEEDASENCDVLKVFRRTN